jgi:superfamily I DNA/RNA helicase
MSWTDSLPGPGLHRAAQEAQYFSGNSSCALDSSRGFFQQLSCANRASAKGRGDIHQSNIRLQKVFRERSGITVSTIHGVKGAEFDVVIAFGLLEGMVPHFNEVNGHVAASKLLYVLSSRARKIFI